MCIMLWQQLEFMIAMAMILLICFFVAIEIKGRL